MFGEFYDEHPEWSAPFGLLLLERVPIKPGLTVLDVGAGTGAMTENWPSVAARMQRLLPKLEYLGKLRKSSLHYIHYPALPTALTMAQVSGSSTTP